MRGPKPSQLELEIPTIRNEGEWLHEAEHLADMHAIREGLVESLRDDTRKRRKEIKARDREISNLAKALREGRHNRKQTDLFQGEAQKALHDVAARVEGKKPLPSEAHEFEGNPLVECAICGALKGDPIHGTLESAAAGNGKASPPVSKARTKPKGPLSRKARPRARA